MTTIDIIRDLCRREGISVTSLEEKLGFSNGSISKQSTKAMKSDRLFAIAKHFNVSMEYLMGSEDISYDEETLTWGTEGYYIDDEAKKYAQFLFENPDYRVLFDASRNVKKEDLERAVIALGLFKHD